MSRAAVVGVMLTAALGCAAADRRFPGVLEIDVEASRGADAHLYFETGGIFSAEAMAVAPLADTRTRQTLRFPVAKPTRRVRFDPFDGPGRVRVLAMRFVPRSGRSLPLELRLADVRDVTRVDRDDGMLTMTATADAADPSLVLATGPLRAASLVAALDEPVSARGVAVVATLLLLILVLPAIAMLRAALRPGGEASPATLAATLLGMACLIIGAKLWIVAAFGSEVPFLDQWKVEAMDVYLPFGWGELRWRDLLAAHNEHRVLPSRVLALSLFLADRRWNPLVQQVANALLHAGAAVLLVLMLWRRAGHTRLVPIAATVTLAFALPFASENTLNGFQSCTYLIPLTLVVALALLPDARPGSLLWLAALAVLALGLVTFGSGLLSIGCVLVYLVLAHGRAHAWRRFALNGAACAALLAVGLALRAPTPVENLRHAAGDVLHFMLLTLGALAFPFVEYPWMASFAWLPMMLLVAHRVRTRSWPDSLEATLLALGAWLVLQAAAIGYSRGNLASVPSSRYLDGFSFVFITNVIAASIVMGGEWRPRERRVRRLAVGAWLVAMVVGLARAADNDVKRFAAMSADDAVSYEQNLRRYLATEDRDWFAALTFPRHLPVQVPALLSEVMLTDPFLRARLPPALAEPLHLRPSRRGTGPFRRDGLDPKTPVDPLAEAWGSFTRDGEPGVGEFASTPIACASGGFVRIDVAGQIGFGDMRIRLVTQRGRVHELAPQFIPRERWEPLFARCPPDSFRVVATDQDAERWFAIRAPVEYGWLSWATAVALRKVWLLLAAGGLLTAWAVWSAARDHAAAPRRARS